MSISASSVGPFSDGAGCLKLLRDVIDLRFNEARHNNFFRRKRFIRLSVKEEMLSYHMRMYVLIRCHQTESECIRRILHCLGPNWYRFDIETSLLRK